MPCDEDGVVSIDEQRAEMITDGATVGKGGAIVTPRSVGTQFRLIEGGD